MKNYFFSYRESYIKFQLSRTLPYFFFQNYFVLRSFYNKLRHHFLWEQNRERKYNPANLVTDERRMFEKIDSQIFTSDS